MKKNLSCFYGLNNPYNSFQKLLLTLKIASMILICSFLNLSATATYSLNIDELQQQTVSGKVTDSQTGQNMPGVNIVVKGTSLGVMTGADGKYSIPVPDRNAVLVFSFVGYISQEVPLAASSVIDVVLESSSQNLEEVVVIGYGTSSRRNLTGSVSVVPVADAKTVSTVSVSNLIEGRISGVDVTTRTAQPGSGVSIQIRGAISPNGSNAPLYVIDGVPISNNAALDPTLSGVDHSGGVDRDYLVTINPADIESISILKDASATAIYGSAAANGVILITTKKGKAGDVSVAYSGSYSVQTAKPYYPIMDATTFMQQADRLSFEEYLYLNKFAPFSTTPYESGFTPKFSTTDIANAGAGTNWLRLLLRTGTIQEHNVSITGGTEKVKTFASFNYYDNEGILKNSSFKRYTGRLNVDYEATRWLKVGANLSYTGTGGNNASSNDAYGPSTYSEVEAAVQFPPNVPYDPKTFDIATHNPYDPNFGNPVGYLAIKDFSSTSRIFVTPNLELTILPNLKFKVQTGYDGSSYERDFYMPGAIKNVYAPNGLANNGLNKNYNISSEEYLTYDAKIGSSQTLNVVLGTGYYKSGSTELQLTSYNFFTDAFGYNNIGIASNLLQTRLHSSKVEHTKLSDFGRINYSILNKYIVTFTIRNDGSSSFAENKKYGLFPGGAVAWKVGEEQFIKNLGFISDLKLRASYGSTGNESIVGNYPLTLYGLANSFAQNGSPIPTVSLTQIGNPNITWETDVMANLALDYGFFNDRLSGTLEFYQKTARNLLDWDPLPLNSAISNIASNVGSRMAQGFDFNLTSKILTGKFKWENDFNISNVKVNWVTRNTRLLLQPWEGQNDDSDVLYGWKTDGIIKSLSDIPSYMPLAYLGNIKYVDINGDGKLDEKDVVRLGNWAARWNFGMNNTFSFMNFDLSIFINGKFGYKQLDGYTRHLYYYNDYYTWRLVGGGEGGSNFFNGCTFVKNILTHDNPKGNLPGVAPDQYAGNNPTGFDDFYLLNGSFIRIKNIKLGYQLPESLIKKTFIKLIRFYVDFDNIAVITKWKGLDPEIQETSPYPQVFTTSFGVNVNF